MDLYTAPAKPAHSGNGNGTSHTTPVPPPVHLEPGKLPTPKPYELLDPIPKRRTSHDEHLMPRVIETMTPVMNDELLEDTELLETLNKIKKRFPGWGALLHWWYNRLVLATIRRYQALKTTVYEKIDQANERTLAISQEVEEEAERLEDSYAEQIASTERGIEATEQKLTRAHRKTAAACAAIALVYDPEDLSGDSILGSPRSLESLAGDGKQVLDDPYAPDYLPSWLKWTLTELIGIVHGLSFGVQALSLQIDTIPRALGLDLMWAIVGMVVTTLNKYLLESIWGECAIAEYKHGTQTLLRRAKLTALSLTLLLVMVELTVDQVGLLALQHVSARVERTAYAKRGDQHTSVSPTHSGTFATDWLCPMFLTIGYVGFFSWAGYARKRHLLVKNELLAQQDDLAEQMRRDLRQDPDAKIALRKLAKTRVLATYLGHLRAQLEHQKGSLTSELAALRACVPAFIEGPSEQDTLRIQDAYYNAVCANLEMLRLLKKLLALAEALTPIPLPLLLGALLVAGLVLAWFCHGR